MRRAQIVLLTVAALVAAASAQQEPQPQQPPPFRAEANLVRVDVTVIDRHGDPVTTLTADDFTVDEDGVPQTVQSFKFVTADGRRVAGDGDDLAIRSPEHAAAEAARDDVRTFVLFWDDYHIDRFVQSIQGKKALSDFVSNAFGPTDLVALMEPLTPMDALRFTRDRAELALKIQKLEGRLGVYLPPRSVLESEQLGGEVERLRSEVTLTALQSAAVHLGSLKEGRKSIVIVTEGFPGLGRDLPRFIQQTTDAANNNNVAIYTVDPRGLMGMNTDWLRALAEDTGGQAFVNSNNPGPALRQVVKDASAFYLLGYASSKNPADGKFHKIGVHLKRSGLEVRARRGYWAPSLTEVERVRTAIAAAEAVPKDLTRAAAALAPPREDRLLDLWIGSAPGADGQPEVTLAWTPRARTNTPGERDRTVSVTIKKAGADRVLATPIDAGRVAFAAPAGPLTIDVSVHDAAGNVLDDTRQTAEVADLTKADVALSSPVLLRARTLAEVRTLASTADPVPFAGREFVRTDRLFVRFQVCGTSADEAGVAAHLLTKAGATLAELPTTIRVAARHEYQIDLPLSATARGEFMIAVEATHGDAHTRMLVPFRVIP